MKLIQVDYSNRVYGLDFFRATAIILVVLGHGSFLAGNLFSFLPSIPLIDGVELFFVLSGFLIGSMLIKNIANTEKFGISDLFTFLKRRWFRTLPNYYLILIVNIILVKFAIISGDLKQCTWEFFLFLQNFLVGFTDFFWESWSLSIEEGSLYILTDLITCIPKIHPEKDRNSSDDHFVFNRSCSLSNFNFRPGSRWLLVGCPFQKSSTYAIGCNWLWRTDGLH